MIVGGLPLKPGSKYDIKEACILGHISVHLGLTMTSNKQQGFRGVRKERGGGHPLASTTQWASGTIVKVYSKFVNSFTNHTLPHVQRFNEKLLNLLRSHTIKYLERISSKSMVPVCWMDYCTSSMQDKFFWMGILHGPERSTGDLVLLGSWRLRPRYGLVLIWPSYLKARMDPKGGCVGNLVMVLAPLSPKVFTGARGTPTQFLSLC